MSRDITGTFMPTGPTKLSEKRVRISMELHLTTTLHSASCHPTQVSTPTLTLGWPENLERPARRCNIFPVWIYL